MLKYLWTTPVCINVMFAAKVDRLCFSQNTSAFWFCWVHNDTYQYVGSFPSCSFMLSMHLRSGTPYSNDCITFSACHPVLQAPICLCETAGKNLTHAKLWVMWTEKHCFGWFVFAHCKLYCITPRPYKCHVIWQYVITSKTSNLI